MSRELEVTVTRLGAAGDGIAEVGPDRVYLPGALPGERWRIRLAGRAAEGWRAEPLACLEAAHRAVPICPYFGRCGGCRLQHLPPEPYGAFKRDRIVAALERRGLPGALVGAIEMAPVASRRRLRLGLARIGHDLRLGFRGRRSHQVEPVDACPIACPELSAALPPLALGLGEVLALPLPKEISITATPAGIDLVLHADRVPTRSERMALPAMVDALALARASWIAGPGAAPEPLAMRQQPFVDLSGIRVDLPPGSFLQPTAFGAERLAAAVGEWGSGCRHAVDLFAGLGTLTFAIDRGARTVRAFEAEAAAVAALRQAAGRAGRGAITAELRDLDRRPLRLPELARCDLAVLDPPRSGARTQAGMLAASAVARIVYAACHPESFARDARILVDGGYDLVAVRPIDQFRYAAEVELAALFRRSSARQKRA